MEAASLYLFLTGELRHLYHNSYVPLGLWAIAIQKMAAQTFLFPPYSVWISVERDMR